MIEPTVDNEGQSLDNQEDEVLIGPQEGPQTDFLSTTADIALYGGAAGGGKTFALLLEPLRHFDHPGFAAMIFRRNTTQIRNKGGLWDESNKLYRPLGARARDVFLEWKFPAGGAVKFAHLENEKTVYNYQGAQIPLIGFDELTHFSESQFFYMLSRNRSTTGIPGYVRATCNPDADSWVRKLVDWYINEEGYPDPEKSGKVRWFIRVEDHLIWGNSPDELISKYGDEFIPKSFTFIPSKLTDNRILMEKDPSYRANLRALSRVERLRLEGGNWNIRASAGEIFRREWFPIVDAIPSGWNGAIRFWDRAATEPSPAKPDPDWTRGLLMLRYPGNRFLVADLRGLRGSPGKVENLVKTVASHDSFHVKIMAQQDPGSAGVAEALAFRQMLAGYNVETVPMSRDKLTRAKPVSAQAEVGNVMVLRAPWNADFFSELENFPDGVHDDIVDCLSGAFNALAGNYSLFDAI